MSNREVTLGDRYYCDALGVLTVVYLGMRLVVVKDAQGHEGTYTREYLKSLKRAGG